MIPALQGYLAAVEESLVDADSLDAAAEQLHAVAALVDGSPDLTSVVDDGALPAVVRRAVLDDLLAGKVSEEVVRLVHEAVTFEPPAEVVGSIRAMRARLAEAADRRRRHPDAPPPEEPALGKLASRNRVWGYAAALFEGTSVEGLEQVEDEIFRFARIVEANRTLRAAFADRELPVTERQALAADLLAGKVSATSARLVAYTVRGGRARDFVGLLDSLVEAAAGARGWRVAKVRSAEPVADDQQRQLRDALGTLTGKPVEIQVTLDPRLLAGAVVEVGDLLVDGTARHRLDRLGEELAHLGPGPATRFTNPIPREDDRR